MVAVRRSAERKPNARWLLRRILLVMPSRLALVRPESMKAGFVEMLKHRTGGRSTATCDAHLLNC
jgi:hypothetical protein